MKYYIDKNQIARLASNADTYHKGYAYWLNGKVRDVQLSDEDGALVAHVTVGGVRSDRSVMIAFDRNGILQKYRCMCPSSGIWSGACKHVVAALLRLFEANRESVVLSRSARIAGTTLKRFEDLMYAEAVLYGGGAEAFEAAALAPRFVVENERAYLSFAIGRGKMYIVKSVRDFVSRMRGQESFIYGKAFSFTHRLDAFEVESRALAVFVLREYDMLDAFANAKPELREAMNQFTNARNMLLTPRGLDDFFALCAGQTLDVSIYGTPLESVTLTDDAPDVQFALAEESGGLSLSLDEEVRLFAGETHAYLLRGDRLHRVSKELQAAVEPILAAYKQLGARKLVFTRTEAPRVRAFVASRLRSEGMLAVENGHGKYNALLVGDDVHIVPLETKMFFDMDGKDVVCELQFCYGETVYTTNAAPDAGWQDRDVLAELRAGAVLRQIGFTQAAADGGGLFRLSGDDRAYRFFHEPVGLAAARAQAEVYVTDAVRSISDKPRVSASVGLRIAGNLLEVKVNPQGFPMLEMMEILESFRAKKKYHRLRDGSFINLGAGEEREAVSALDDLAQSLGAGKRDVRSEGFAVPRFRALAADETIIRHGALLQAKREGSFDALLQGLRGGEDFPVPALLADVLRAYQAEGFRWMMCLDRAGFGGILADDMGLGKTVQVIAVLLEEKIKHDARRLSLIRPKEHRPSLVVAPTSLVYNWEKEIARFAPVLKVQMVCGTREHRQSLLQGKGAGADVLITTYDMLKRDIEQYEAFDFRFIIADEAQNIKNPATQNAKAIKLLTGSTRFALTGTPVENALIELWSIFDFVMPGYLHSRAKFSKLYEAPILREENADAAGLLRRQTAPFILRRLKSDVLTELPEKIETTLYAEMTEEQAKVYTAYLMRARGELTDAFGGDAEYKENSFEILSRLTRLRQLCCHPATFLENYAGGSGKLDVTMELVASSVAAGHRILIFSQFTKMLAILAEMLAKEAVSFFCLDGATASKERLDMAERFNAGERDVFLISLKAGGTGLNLTGADVVIHYDPWWNPAVMEQAADRAHRFGQDKTVQVISVVAKDSVEEKVVALQAKKKDLIDSVIAENAQFISRMTKDEVEALFG